MSPASLDPEQNFRKILASGVVSGLKKLCLQPRDLRSIFRSRQAN